MTLQPGVYFLYNVVSGTVLDLSGVDRRAIIGYHWHGEKNQQWEFRKLGDSGWSIRCLYSSNSHYLTVEDGLGNAIPVVANEYPVAWRVEDVPSKGDDVYCILWGKTKYAVDLDSGLSADSTKVNLWEKSGVAQQYWKLVRVPGQN